MMKANSQILVGVGLLVASTGLILALPKHRLGAGSNLKARTEAIAKMSKIAKASDEGMWLKLEKCSGFQQTSGHRQGDVTIFMDGSDYDIKQFSTQFTDYNCWSNLTIIPLPNPAKPNAEKFLKLCLLHKWGATSVKQATLAKGMTPTNPEVDKLWDQVSAADKAKVSKQLADNVAAHQALGDFAGYYRFKGIYFKSKEYIGATTCQMYGAQL